ncbi:MAG: phosphoglycerate kinase [Candidatus Roizmanbacteria bacterium]|nr:phosphoglycerate kinase [Candidatus Roizmanbacteria bacterium]
MKFSSLKDQSVMGKKVLLRVDFNVSLTQDHQVADDYRIKCTLPTIQKLLEQNNKIIILAHLGRPKEYDPHFSLKPVQERLQTYVPGYTVVLLNSPEEIKNHSWQEKEILMLENLRFFPGEKKNDPSFAQELASLGDVYVNDAFGNCHRKHASMTGIPKLLPSYAGLLLAKEVEMIERVTQHSERPVVAILGGAKVSTKMGLIEKFLSIADSVLLGGGIANTFLKARGVDIKNSLHEDSMVDLAKKLVTSSEGERRIVLPEDYRWGEDSILDIGPETQKKWDAVIRSAKTIIWNGPVGYFEDERFRAGTIAVFDSIIQNTQAVSVVGGGETVSAIIQRQGSDKITHISTGGGAMLEYIEKGSLPGIEALRSSKA